MGFALSITESVGRTQGEGTGNDDRNDVDGDDFGINLVPHTLQRTTLGEFAAGRAVNIEVDQVARYLERLLLAREQGLHTCPQEAWSLWGKSIREFTGIPESDLIFCGLALGYADSEAAINALYSDRSPVDEFATFRGFE